MNNYCNQSYMASFVNPYYCDPRFTRGCKFGNYPQFVNSYPIYPSFSTNMLERSSNMKNFTTGEAYNTLNQFCQCVTSENQNCINFNSSQYLDQPNNHYHNSKIKSCEKQEKYESDIQSEEKSSSDYERKEANDEKYNSKEYDKLKQIMEKMEVLNKKRKKTGNETHYHLRKDVITKTIFRAARKYYIRKFKSFYDFTKLSQSGYEDLQNETREKVRVYLRKMFGEQTSEVLNAIFIAILDPKGIHIALESEGEEFRELVFKLLFKFNKANMEQLMMYREFIKLISVFLNEPDLIRIIVKTHRDKATEKAYQRQCDLMKAICESDSSIIPKILLTFL